ncbi:hypothetical protein [Ideonella sp.]|jgi:flagellar biosynthesis/type III secretory pathway protein FliH|uniref:hypothetical protein n=1 Tax=Ideonella sp. TaxID=1929293 RepID=UPI0037C02348
MQPQLIRQHEWVDWQQSALAGRFVAACAERALTQAVSAWSAELDHHQALMRQQTEAAQNDAAGLRQQALAEGRQAGLNQWLEHLMVWTHHRRTRLSTLREDMAQLLCTVLGQVLSSTPARLWMAEVLARLDALVDGQHTMLVHVSSTERQQAAEAVELWWSTAGWCGAPPQVLGHDTLAPGQCRLVSAAGEVVVDLPGLIKAFEQCVLPARPEGATSDAHAAH